MSSPVPMFGTQNTKDDDGPVIDSLFLEVNAPPNPADAIEPIPQPELPAPKPVTRLVTGTYTFDVAGIANAPWMLLPPDANRKSLELSAYNTVGTGATEYLSLADESGKCNTSSAFTIRPHRTPFTIDAHTGAVWVQTGPGITGSITLTWIAVTA